MTTGPAAAHGQRPKCCINIDLISSTALRRVLVVSTLQVREVQQEWAGRLAKGLQLKCAAPGSQPGGRALGKGAALSPRDRGGSWDLGWSSR